MADKAQTPEATPGEEPTPAPPKRSPGHRGTDVRDAVAEMTARAHEISLEAGSKMASALKDVVNAAAGLAGFAIESTRDLVQYMVRRGQMTQDEADKLLREAEEAHARRKGATPPTEREITPPRIETRTKPPEVRAAEPVTSVSPVTTVTPVVAPAAPAVKKAATKAPATKEPAAKEPAAKEPAAKAAKPPAAKVASKSGGKPAAKAADRSGSAKKSTATKASAKAPAKAQSKKPTGRKR